MAIGFPAHFTESRTCELEREELSAVIKIALENLNWKFETREKDESVAQLRNSPMTFGEEFTIHISENHTFQVDSRCVIGGRYRMPQIFDFGANKVILLDITNRFGRQT